MSKIEDKAIAIFEGYKIRRHYDEKKEIWYFSVIDILHVLLQNSDYQISRKYWNKLKERLKKEGSQSVTNCHQLKFPAADGKKYNTDAADPRTLLRLIQSIPSPKAELSTRQIAENTQSTGLDGKYFWKSRTPEEKLLQVDILRRINYGRKATNRLQRVLEITKR